MSKVKSTPKPWTKKEEAYLLKYSNKLSAKQIAIDLGRPYGGVVWKKGQLKEQEIPFIPIKKSPVKYCPPKVSVWGRVKEFFS